MPHPTAYKVPVTFQEVAASFSKHEWNLLHEWQKELYKNLMKEIHQALLLLGPAIAASVFSLRAEENEDVCHVDNEFSERGDFEAHSPVNDISEVIISAIIKEETEADPSGYQESNELQAISCATGDNVTMAGVGGIIKEDNTSYSTAHKGHMARESVPDFPDITTVFGSNIIDGCSTDEQHAVVKGNNANTHQSDTESKNKNKVHRCKACKKHFTCDSGLIEGIMGTSAHFCCAACESRCINKAPVMVHQAPHSECRMFTCTECEKSFLHKKNLLRHQLVHSEVKPFSCNECEKRFTQKVHLRNHQRIHSGVKPFFCTECNKTFTRKASLLYHQQTHSRLRPFSCMEYAKTFT